MAAVLPDAEWEKHRRNIYIFEELPAKIWSVKSIASPLATNRHTFLDAIVSAEISEMEAKESAT